MRALPLSLLLLAAAPAGALPSVGGCPLLPFDDIWNTPIDNLPLDPNSAAYVSTIGSSSYLHADFGSGTWEGYPIGIPYNIVPQGQPLVDVAFLYADESDPGPYPIPPGALIEGGSDHHVLVVQQGSCRLYETYASEPQPDGSWSAGSGAVFDLNSSALRPAGWTSADAAGLPILPGLARYDEVAAGEINHALRFTAPETRRAYVWPARHYASSLTASNYPPMGQRFRLKASFNSSGFSPQAQVILTALKRYGMILADNGSSWYISGAPDEGWDNDQLHELHQLTGSDFEAVDLSSLLIDADSGRVPCSGSQIAVESRHYVSGEQITCTASEGIATSGTVEVEAGAQVEFMAPQVALPPNLHVKPGAAFRAGP